MIARVARGLGAALVVGGLIAGGICVADHVEARDRWAEEAGRVGDPSYDARRSDQAYDDAVAARRRAELLAMISVPGLLLLGLFVPAREAPAGAARVTGRRAHLASLADGLVVAALIVTARSVEGWLGADWAALGALLGVQLHGLALGAGLAAMIGASVGGRLTGTTVVDGGGGRPGVGRAGAALLLWPIGLLWAPLALAFAPRSRTPHLAWTGLHRVASQSENE